MKKSIVLLPLLMLVLAACNPTTTSESNSEPINSDTSTDRFLASIAVTTEPTDKDYTAGQNFDPAGMVVTATYDDATTAVVTHLCTYSPSPLTQGLTEVTVSYKEGTITKTTTVTGIVVVAPQEVEPVEVTINKAIPVGWTYISNNPESYPDPAFYSAGQLKINFVEIGIQSPVLDGAYHKVTIGGVLNTNTKTDGKATTLDLVVNGQMVDDWEASGTPFSGVELNFPNGFTQFSIIMSGNVGYNVGLGTILVS